MSTVTGYTDPRKLVDLRLLALNIWEKGRFLQLEKNTEMKNAFFDLMVADTGMRKVREYVEKKREISISTTGEEEPDKRIDKGVERLRNSWRELYDYYSFHGTKVPSFVPRGLNPFAAPKTLVREHYRELLDEEWDLVNEGNKSESLLDVIPSVNNLANKSWARDYSAGKPLPEKIVKATIIGDLHLDCSSHRPFVMVCPACGKITAEKQGKASSCCGKEPRAEILIHFTASGRIDLKEPRTIRLGNVIKVLANGQLINCFITGKTAERILGITTAEKAKLSSENHRRDKFYAAFEDTVIYGQVYRTDYYRYLMLVHGIEKKPFTPKIETDFFNFTESGMFFEHVTIAGLDMMNKVLSEYGSSIAIQAVKIAKRDGREIVTGEDIELALIESKPDLEDMKYRIPDPQVVMSRKIMDTNDGPDAVSGTDYFCDGIHHFWGDKKDKTITSGKNCSLHVIAKILMITTMTIIYKFTGRDA